jgi:hypothetical protein
VGAFRDAGTGHPSGEPAAGIGLRLVRVVVWFQFFRPVRMIVRAVFALVLVRVLRIACMGMLVLMLVLMFVFVLVFVLVSVGRPIVGVFMCMRMSVFVLMLVAMIVLTFHRISSLFPVWRRASSDKPILAEPAKFSASFLYRISCYECQVRMWTAWHDRPQPCYDSECGSTKCISPTAI